MCREIGFQIKDNLSTEDEAGARVERLVRHFGGGDRSKLADVATLGMLLQSSPDRIRSDLPRAAAAFCTLDSWIRSSVEAQLVSSVPQGALLRFMECASYDETPLRLGVYQDPTKTLRSQSRADGALWILRYQLP